MKTINGSASNGTVVTVIDVAVDMTGMGTVLNWSLTGATSRNSSKTMFRLAAWTGYRGEYMLPRKLKHYYPSFVYV